MLPLGMSRPPYFASGLLAASLAVHCGAPEPEEAPAPEPPADQESWSMSYELIEPGLRVDIDTRYMQHHGSSARADSGVVLLFHDADGDTLLHLRAATMDMEGGDRVDLGGAITASGDSLVVWADSLIWERSGRRLMLPGEVRVEAAKGEETGRNLETDLDLSSWRIGRVAGRYWGTAAGRAYDVTVAADSAVSVRSGGRTTVEYSSATVRSDDLVLHSPVAVYDGHGGALDLAGGVAARDSLEEVRADALSYQLGISSWQAAGSVELTRGDWQLAADTLRRDGDAKPLVALGSPAAVRQADRTLKATRLEYLDDEREFVARGQVVFHRNGTELRAGRVSFMEGAETIAGSGGVTLQTDGVEGQLAADSLFLHLADDQAVLFGAPRLVRPAGTESLTVAAAVLRVDLERETLAGNGEYLLQSGSVSMTAHRGTIAPGDDGSDVVTLAGSVTVENDDGVVRGDSMETRLVDGRIAEVRVPGRLDVQTMTAAEQATWVRGRDATIVLAENRIDLIELGAEAEVIHNDAAGDEVSQISGQRMELLFAAGAGLVRIHVTGEAQFTSRLASGRETEEPALNQVRGEELAVLLEGGQIDEVIITRPQGNYYPGPKEGSPQ